MTKPVEYRQGETVFFIHRFPPFKAMCILGELQKIILPAVGGAVNGLKGSDEDAAVNSFEVLSNIASGVLDTLPQHLDCEKMESLMHILLIEEENIGVTVKGSKAPIKLNEMVINEVFEGRPLDIIALMVKVVRVNYLDFSKLCGLPRGVQEVLTNIAASFSREAPQNLEA